MTKSSITGHLSAFIAYAIFGFNIIVCKDLTSGHLIPVAQKRIRPTLVSMYSYIQPIISIVISIVIGMDHLTWQKILAAAMVFGGVIIVSYSRSAGR